MPVGLPCSAEGQPERPRAAGVLLPSPLAAPKEVAWGAQVEQPQQPQQPQVQPEVQPEAEAEVASCCCYRHAHLCSCR